MPAISMNAQNPAMKVFEEWHDTVGTQNTFYKSVTRVIPGTTNVNLLIRFALKK